MPVVIRPVILSGGAGTRLWPLSRELYPKQLNRMMGERTLLQQTIIRLNGLEEAAAPLLVCNEEHRFLASEQLEETGVIPCEILLEPIGRNTAPALTLAALALRRQGGDEPMLVMPADHVIRDVPAFQRAVRQAVPLASGGRIATFGIVPDRAETGYGYIRCGDTGAVTAFTEKPDAATAQRYIAAGNYYWNSGMFLLRPSVWLEEIGKYQNEVLEICQTAFAKSRRDGLFCHIPEAAFVACPSDSIDYAVMEKTGRASMVPLDAQWSDVGAWSTLWQISEQDDRGNSVQGDVYAHDTRNALLISSHRLLATVGIEDMIVVETPDAVLVARRDKAQDVREIVEWLRRTQRTEHQLHRVVYRPWGSYEAVDAGEHFQVKRLIVKPGAALSLQMHRHRAEHWVVVRGTARVTRGTEVFVLTENQSTYIPIGVRHRLENPDTVPLEIVEVQSGTYLGEDDIVRFEDKYDRHKGT